MRILHINSYDFGGAANAALRLHKGLLDLEVDSTFMTTKKSRYDIPSHCIPNGEAYINESFCYPTIKNIVKGNYQIGNRNIIQAVKLRKEVKKIALLTNKEMASYYRTNYRLQLTKEVQIADIIHLHWVADFIDYPSFFKAVKKPIVWTLHDENPFRGLFHYKNDESTNLDPRLIYLDKKDSYPQKAAALGDVENLTLVTPSEWLKQVAKQSSFFGDRPVHKIYYGLNTTVYQPYERHLARKVFNLSSEKKIVLFVSDYLFNYRKGFDLLLDAVNMGYNWEVELCAVGKYSTESLPAQVKYLGNINDERLMALAYSAADVFVLPSREDNLPNTMIESLCCGTPVIAFPIGGIVETINNRVNGILANDVSANGLAKALNLFFDKKIPFNRDEIRKAAIEKFTMKMQAENYLELYQKVLSLK